EHAPVEKHEQAETEQKGQQEVVLFRREHRLPLRLANEAAQVRPLAVIEGGQVLVEGINPREWKRQHERDWQQEKAAGLNRGLRNQNAAEATNTPGRWEFASHQRPELKGEHALAGFHPNKKESQSQGSSRQMLTGSRTAAHIGPKIKQGEDERQC